MKGFIKLNWFKISLVCALLVLSYSIAVLSSSLGKQSTSSYSIAIIAATSSISGTELTKPTITDAKSKVTQKIVPAISSEEPKVTAEMKLKCTELALQEKNKEDVQSSGLNVLYMPPQYGYSPSLNTCYYARTVFFSSPTITARYIRDLLTGEMIFSVAIRDDATDESKNKDEASYYATLTYVAGGQ